MLKRVQIHTDGACRGNPGPGGYGAVLISGKHRLEIAEGYILTTNNRMELMAAIAALEVLKQPCEIQLISDSRYVVDAMNKHWLRSWEAKGWRTAANGPVKNQDLWQRLSKAITAHKIQWTWIKGHAGHQENERCDVLAVAASRKNLLLEDKGFNS